MNPASYRNTRVQNTEENVYNVDILFSVIGGSKPPTLPLREERQTDGVELVYNAKGTGHSAVCKEKMRREQTLLEKLNRLEQKLARKPSYKRTTKRQKALKMVRELKYQLEHSASGISYKRYLDELKQMRRALKSVRALDDSSHASENSGSTVNTGNIESKVMNAIEKILDDPDIDIDDLDTEAGSIARNDKADKSIKSSTEDSSKSECNNESSAPKREDEVEKDECEDLFVPKPLETILSTPNIKTFEKSALRRHASAPPKAPSVRFKDVKPTLDDRLAQAKALLNHAKGIQKSFSNESNTSIDKELVKNTNSNIIRQTYSGGVSIVGEKGRYHLFVSHACSWSHRCLVVRALKRLQNVVSISYVDCVWAPQQLCKNDAAVDTDRDISFWLISGKNPDYDPTFNSFKRHFLKSQEGKIRVPILWDKSQNKVVSKESTEIMKILNFEFNEWSRRPRLNLFPAGFKQENEKINQWLHEKLYLGIYRSGLATTQEQYDQAIHNVTGALDEADRIVRERGFLTGGKLTESDVRLFVVLLRFDEVYKVLFKVNSRAILHMPGLMEFCRDIYQVKGMKEVCNFDCIKREFYGAKGGIFIVPRGGKFISALSSTSSI